MAELPEIFRIYPREWAVSDYTLRVRGEITGDVEYSSELAASQVNLSWSIEDLMRTWIRLRDDDWIFVEKILNYCFC